MKNTWIEEWNRFACHPSFHYLAANATRRNSVENKHKEIYQQS